jgi:branched-subunit amino acid aminotransferase/4-amino-4-deoxychorismate lyase
LASDPSRLIWVDGELLPVDRRVVRADDCAFAEGRGCYTSVGIVSGRPRFPDRHLRRLQRGARALRLGEIDANAFARALSELGAAALPSGEGVIRLQLSRSPGEPLQLTAAARSLGEDRAEWSAISSTLRHTGAVLAGGHKLTNRLVLTLAADEATAAGADEALLFDATDRLVEGSRCNFIVVAADGLPAAPVDDLGAVTGIALEVVLERLPEIGRRAIAREELRGARELVALNSVRGARPITRLDSRAVADGSPGPWAARIQAAFESG